MITGLQRFGLDSGVLVYAMDADAWSTLMAPQLLLMGATLLVLSRCNAAAYAVLAGGRARVLDAATRRVVHRLGAVSLMGHGRAHGNAAAGLSQRSGQAGSERSRR
jgi:hypothetical protein